MKLRYEITGVEKIDVGFSGTIEFRPTGDTIECVIQYITKDFSDAVVFTSDPRVSRGEDVVLMISLPLDRTPVKCFGKIVARSVRTETLEETNGYLARIFISDISRLDRRRLELVIVQRKAFISAGKGVNIDKPAKSSTQPAGEPAKEGRNAEALASEIESLKGSLTNLENTVKQQKDRLEQANRIDAYNILVVDDEVANLSALERTLRALKQTFGHDYNIFSATNGKDALEIMAKHDVGFIIADQRMPGMTGVEFLEKTLVLYPDTVRIMLTAYTDEQLLMDAINKVHVHGYISKPWEPEEILALLREGLESQKMTRSRILGKIHKPGLSAG